MVTIGNVVRVGRESAPGTVATTFTAIPSDFKSVAKQEVFKPEEYRSSQDEFFMAVAGRLWQEWEAAGGIYHDTFPWCLVSLLGAPTTAAVGADTSAKDHVFVPVNSPPSLTTQWYQTIQAYQALNSVVDELTVKFGGEDQLTYDVKGFAYQETELAAPAYTFSEVKPFAHWQGAVTLGGATYNGLASAEITYKRSRAARFRVANQRGPVGMDIGRRGGMVKVTIDFENVTEYNNAKNATKRDLTVKFVDGNTTIGSTLVNPSIEFKLPRLHWESHELDLGGATPMLVLEAPIYYDSTAGYAIQTTVRNVTASY